MTNNIEHSALGSHWTKKNHKYIAIENGRYIYPEDVKGSKKPVSAKFDQKTRDLDQAVLNSRFNPSRKRRQQNAKAAEAQARLDAEQRRLDAVNRMNQKEQKNSKDYVYSYDQKGILTKTPKSSSTFKEAEAKRAKEREDYVKVNRRIKAQKDANEAAKRTYYRQKAITKERQAASGYDEKGNKIRHIEPKGPAGYDNRGFKKNLPAPSTEYDEHGVKYKPLAARKHKAISEKEAKMAEREQKIKQKQLQEQIKDALKRRKKAEKERRKEINKQIPASMRRKRNIKRGKKAVDKFLTKLFKGKEL